MYVIFLDIDGVMNSSVFYKERWNRRWLEPITYWYELKYLFKKLFRIKSKGVSLADWKPDEKSFTFKYQFERLKEETCKQKWQWLSEWCNENDIKICVSSVWKHHFGTKEYKSTPEKWEDAFQLLGFKPGTFVGITGNRQPLRGTEIQEWLDHHPEVIDYAIIDDDSDMLEHQFEKFHHVDRWFGLTPNHLYRIKSQFDKEYSYGNLNERNKKLKQKK